MQKYWKLLILLTLFLMAIHPPVDLDLGWHLRYGEYFFEHGQVLKDNIISYIWPDYKWVQASWGYDLLTYLVFKGLGHFGMALFGGIFTLIIFLLITYPIKRLSPFLLFFLGVVFLTQSAPLYFTGMRSQTPSTVFFGAVLVISYLSFENFKSKAFYFLPLIFLFWANMHGGFALGLILLWIIWLSFGGLILYKRLNKAKFEVVSSKRWLMFGLMLVLSCLTPLLNPWGLRIYEETFKHSTNTNLGIISEWRPLTQAPFESVVTCLVAVFTLATSFMRKKINQLPFMVAFLVVTYLAFSALRFTINFGVMSVYFLALNIPELKWSFVKNRKRVLSCLKLALFLFIFLDILVLKKYLMLPELKILTFSWDDYCKQTFECSENVTKAMLQNPPKGNGYHSYNYGGYLSFRVPQVKTFVDGRMAAWEENGDTPPIVEADRALFANSPISFKLLESRYRIQWVVVPTPSVIANYLDNQVENQKWDRLYRDSLFSYYVKN